MRHQSPDGKLVLYTFWNSYFDQTVTISVLEGAGDPDEASNVLYEIPTAFHVKELVDCVRWDGNNRFILKADDKEHAWERQGDRTWRQAN